MTPPLELGGVMTKLGAGLIGQARSLYSYERAFFS